MAIHLVVVFQHQMIILENGLMVITPVNIRIFLIMTNGKRANNQSLLNQNPQRRQKIQGLQLATRLSSLLWLHDLRLSLRAKSLPILGNGVMVLAPANIAISLLIRDGTGVNNRNLLNLSNQVRPG